MNKYKRAAQIWSILALSVHSRQLLTYGMLEKLTGIFRPGLGQCLDPIQSYCLRHDLPPLTVLAVGEDTDMPGGGFIAAKDIPQAQQKVFTHDWLGHGAPSPETLEEAWE